MTTNATFVAAVAVWLGSAVAAQADSSRAQVPPPGAWVVRTVDRTSGKSVGSVLLAFPDHNATRITNDRGLTSAPEAVGTVRVLATRLGYADLDTLVQVPQDGSVVEFRLERAAVALPPLTVAAERRMTSRELHRTMFDREVVVGAVGMTQAEIKAVPTVGEPDVFRSLQAAAGVTSVSDLGGQLFVRGGDGGQVSVLVDGAPVFAPYHMFGMFGAFNADAIETTEFYKGSLPARHGGSLSGVVSARQRSGGSDRIRVSGGLSVVGLRIVADGSVPWGDLRWMAAGRKATVDVAKIGIPYSFHDLNFTLQAHPGAAHRLRLSVFASDDDYRWLFGENRESATLNSRWKNFAGSLGWSWVRGNRLAVDVTGYHSRYGGRLALGGSSSSPATTSGIEATGLRSSISVRGELTGLRAGVAVEGGPVELIGSELGAYMTGDASGSYLHGSAFAEVERWIGPFRLTSGVRAGVENKASRVFLEPRLAARYRQESFAVSATLDRTYQFLSVLRDALYTLPGAPMWFVHDSSRPASVADGASLALDLWRGDAWTASLAGWARRFRDVPHWRADTSRDFGELEFNDGSARGFEATVQRHSGQVRGWITYQWARVAFADVEGADYYPQWDRRHEVDGTMSLTLSSGIEASLRAVVGTGTPFWLPSGRYVTSVYDPYFPAAASVERRNHYTGASGGIPLWSQVQGRVPLYARYDATVRYKVRWGAWEIVPFASVVNLADRKNVLLYDSFGEGLAGRPIYTSLDQLRRIPFIGIDFRFQPRVPEGG